MMPYYNEKGDLIAGRPPKKDYKLNTSAREFRELIETAGCADQYQAAELLASSLRTVQKYANGEPIPPLVIRFLKVLIRYKIRKKDLEAL